MDGERAGIDVADRVDQAHHPPGTAQVQSRQGLPVAGQVEERVTSKNTLPPADQPVIKRALLVSTRMQFVPDVSAPPGRTQPGEPQLRPVLVSQGRELIQLADVL